MKGGFFPSRIEILEKPQISIKSKEKIRPFKTEFQTLLQDLWCNDSKDLVSFFLSDTKPHVVEQIWTCASTPAVPRLQQQQQQGLVPLQELLGFWAPSFSSWAQDSTSAPVCRCSSAGTEVLLWVKMTAELSVAPTHPTRTQQPLSAHNSH